MSSKVPIWTICIRIYHDVILNFEVNVMPEDNHYIIVLHRSTSWLRPIEWGRYIQRFEMTKNQGLRSQANHIITITFWLQYGG
jgi:hypothetical protein